MSTLYNMSDFGATENTPNRIIIHAMGENIADGKIYSANKFLDKIGLSAHALVLPDGDVIRMRADTQGAYHARGYNLDSLGVEFLVQGIHTYGSFIEAIKTDYITSEQYDSGVELVNQMLYDNDIKHINRHSDVSPGRKSDPGPGFPWIKFKDDVNFNFS